MPLVGRTCGCRWQLCWEPLKYNREHGIQNYLFRYQNFLVVMYAHITYWILNSLKLKTSVWSTNMCKHTVVRVIVVTWKDSCVGLILHLLYCKKGELKLRGLSCALAVLSTSPVESEFDGPCRCPSGHCLKHRAPGLLFVMWHENCTYVEWDVCVLQLQD